MIHAIQVLLETSVIGVLGRPLFSGVSKNRHRVTETVKVRAVIARLSPNKSRLIQK